MWSKKQRMKAAHAAKVARISDEHRKLILLQYGNRAIVDGKPTSTSPKLTQGDFDHFMQLCESMNGGKAPGFEPGHFDDSQANEMKRLRFVAIRIANTLALTDRPDGDGRLLAPDNEGLRGWIRERVTRGRTDDIEQLTYGELQMLINGLSAYARRNRVDIGQRSTASAGIHG
jgi:hypothetical protein